VALEVRARPAADDFLNPQDPGPRLTLVPFVGPGFRAVYDHRIEIEEDVTELRTQVAGTVAFPFAEASAGADVRLFLLTAGASVGYHHEWHQLRFEPDETGTDAAGVAARSDESALRFFDLDRGARRVKDQNTDVGKAGWLFYEARAGFLWPAQNFMGVVNLAARHSGRGDVTYDWENATVMNGGWHLRGEGYALLRHRKAGFAGLAVRALFVPRNRVPHDVTVPATGTRLPGGSACQAYNVRIPCVRSYEFELSYGVLAGWRPGLTETSDVLFVRALTTLGLRNELFGTHALGAPLQLLFAYMFNIE
jgi:hypothetical protein